MKKLFEKIRLAHLYNLCNIIEETDIRDLLYIKRKYQERALSFDENLSLLEELSIIKKTVNELLPGSNFAITQGSIEAFKTKFILILFSANAKISDYLGTFLLNFQIGSNNIFFKATTDQKIKYSEIRNLLLELGFISTASDNATYYIQAKYADLFEEHFRRKNISPESLKNKQAENDALGLMAEELVIEYEIKRLVNVDLEFTEILHVSRENTNAGYDIKSFENFLDHDSKPISRYIEVKAVSTDDFKFYWSRNEISIAKIFGERYFLYLLPVSSGNAFDLEKLLIIQNPYQNVYLNASDWEKTEESISFSLSNQSSFMV